MILPKNAFIKMFVGTLKLFLNHLKNLGWTFLESIVCALAGPRWTSRVDWCYSVCRYEGLDIPFVTQRRAIFGIAMPMNEEAQRAAYAGMSRHYNAWFQNGTWERILDPQRVRYLREHCGWSNLSDPQLKDENFRLLGF